MDVAGNVSAILGQKAREIFSVPPEATVYDAVKLMADKNVGALLVLEAEKLVGLISERDYSRKIMLKGKRSRETKVNEIMSTQLTVIPPNEPVDRCLRLMTDKRVRHLPVLDGEKVIGVISIGDLVKYMIDCQSAAIEHLESYIHGGFR
jgi:CBS domain-containing protein